MPIDISMTNIIIALILVVFIIMDGRNDFSCTILLLGAIAILFLLTIILTALIIFSPILLIALVILLIASGIISLFDKKK